METASIKEMGELVGKYLTMHEPEVTRISIYLVQEAYTKKLRRSKMSYPSRKTIIKGRLKT